MNAKEAGGGTSGSDAASGGAPSGSASGTTSSGAIVIDAGSSGAPSSEDAGDAASDATFASGDASIYIGYDGGPFGAKPSPGCFKANAWTGALGTYVNNHPVATAAFPMAATRPIPLPIAMAILRARQFPWVRRHR